MEKRLKHRENSEGLSCRERTCIDYGKCEYSLANRAEQAKKNLQKLFSENPDLKTAFKETVDELSMPENIERQSKEICEGLAAIQQFYGGLKDGKEIRDNKGTIQER